MSREASKFRSCFGELEKRVFIGKGIDIGCGEDPIRPDVYRFDEKEGDANEISRYIHETFDYVFSSHCLEHMHDPSHALREWWKLVKPGAYLCITVPDEDLYEQGNWPSRFNGGHKHTFTIHKPRSWSPVSINVVDLIAALKNAKIWKIELQDRGYDYSLLGKNIDQTKGEAMAQICFILQKEEEEKAGTKARMAETKR
ncbi:MAG: class I SAM-dependent methyltransferase [Puniceicoccales bacterium]|jgi:SAM-dependent methyltransferase|nr:class I SAM-dependent methyltransferase [Puniceicoccales bacterium]